MEHYHLIAEKCVNYEQNSKLVILPQIDDMQNLEDMASAHRHIAILHVSDIINDERFLPAADALFFDAEKIIKMHNSAQKVVWMFGIDGLLTLWNTDNVTAAYNAIRDIFDDISLHLHIFSHVYNEQVDTVFANTRYDRNIFRIVNEHQDDNVMANEIVLLDRQFDKWQLEGQRFQNFKSFLKDFEQGIVEDKSLFIFTSAPTYPLATICDKHPQIYKLSDFLHRFCNLNRTMPERALNWVAQALGGKCENTLNSMQTYFFPDGFSQQVAKKQVFEKMNTLPSEQKEIMLWMLKNSISDRCYLKIVLEDDNVTSDNFLKWYVCKALDIWDDPFAKDYAVERREALKPVLVNAVGALDSFIEKLKAIDDARCCCWLNNGTQAEKHEMLRRVMADDAWSIPQCIYDNYPLLEGYMNEYNLGTDELNKYFNEYRWQKLKNCIQTKFCENASDVCYPPKGIRSRTLALQQYANDGDAALIVVDALGVEYMPAILYLAKTHSLDVATAETTYSQLPTSTPFNPIDWSENRRLNDIKKLDEIIHNGAESQTEREHEDNIAALFDVLEHTIIPEISRALARYNTVVLTSDHGASRLAVLAYKEGFSKNLALPENASPEDWRYSPAIQGNDPPYGTISNLQGNYWIVKGYNRFCKRGGKLNELHGGLTWEEMLVPVIVFSQGAVFRPANNGTLVSEFENDSDFDDL